MEVHWRIQGRGPLFLDQIEARRAEENFVLRPSPPPLSQGLNDQVPPLSEGLAPTLGSESWIRVNRHGTLNRRSIVFTSALLSARDCYSLVKFSNQR